MLQPPQMLAGNAREEMFASRHRVRAMLVARPLRAGTAGGDACTSRAHIAKVTHLHELNGITRCAFGWGVSPGEGEVLVVAVDAGLLAASHDAMAARVSSPQTAPLLVSLRASAARTQSQFACAHCTSIPCPVSYMQRA